MGTSNAFYVRSNLDELKPHLPKFSNAKVEAGDEFVGVNLAETAFEPPAEKLLQLSLDLKTDVIWLSFQSVVDAFKFHHWENGFLRRSLVFGCYEEERTWEKAEGSPELWEREVFFSEDQLQRWLGFMESEAEKSDLRRIWAEHKLAPGNIYPSIDARESARAVAHYYKFPGWG